MFVLLTLTNPSLTSGLTVLKHLSCWEFHFSYTRIKTSKSLLQKALQSLKLWVNWNKIFSFVSGSSSDFFTLVLPLLTVKVRMFILISDNWIQDNTNLSSYFSIIQAKFKLYNNCHCNKSNRTMLIYAITTSLILLFFWRSRFFKSICTSNPVTQITVLQPLNESPLNQKQINK